MQDLSHKTEYLSITELAKKLGVSRVTVFKKIRNGQILAERIGRVYAIPTEEVNNILAGNISGELTEAKKEEIKKDVEKIVTEYGETLKLLGKE